VFLYRESRARQDPGIGYAIWIRVSVQHNDDTRLEMLLRELFVLMERRAEEFSTRFGPLDAMVLLSDGLFRAGYWTPRREAFSKGVEERLIDMVREISHIYDVDLVVSLPEP